MGLDMVEFVMGVEEAFGIFIPDADAEHIRTPGQLVDYVEARAREGAAPGCLEQRAFYRVRRAAMQVLKQPRKAVTPTTPWSALLHPNHQRRQWQLVAEVVGVRPWPALRPLFGLASATHSVGDTARTLAASTPAAFLWPEEGWNRSAIEATIQRLMLEQFGLQSFKWTDRFIEDLHCS